MHDQQQIYCLQSLQDVAFVRRKFSKDIQEKQLACVSLLLKVICQQFLSFVMGTHPSVGSDSPVRMLNRDMLGWIQQCYQQCKPETPKPEHRYYHGFELTDEEVKRLTMQHDQYNVTQSALE
jgi:hypothetical protein